MKPWQLISSDKLLETFWVTVRKDAVRLPSGMEIDDYYVVERKDFSIIFALTPEDEVVLVRQYKHGAGEVMLELPAGFIEDGEAPEKAAAREFEEETGWAADEIEKLGELVVGPSSMKHRAYAYLIRKAFRKGSQNLDSSEEIDVVLMPAGEIAAAVMDGRINCMSSAAVVLMALEKLKK